MKEFFKQWLKEYPDPYGQRYRKNIPFNWVKEHAILLMTLTAVKSHTPRQSQRP